MVSYDSDSSGEELDDYATTNVLLGYASKEPTDDSISQLGGHPVCFEVHVQLSHRPYADGRCRYGHVLSMFQPLRS